MGPKSLDLLGLFLVLPVRIELTTSPLPRECVGARIYLTRRRFFRAEELGGADLRPHSDRAASDNVHNLSHFQD